MIILKERAEGAGRADASLTLAYDQRIKSRIRVRLDDGREAGLFLERGTVLRDGDLLRSDQGWVVEVKAAAEQVSTAIVDNCLMLARACYHLGNRHIPLQIDENWVRYQADHVLDDMLRAMGLEVVHGMACFEPEAGAYGHHGEHHGHAH
jgi:urease accessory protein